jgi:membrane-associated phospholipid phosphatase
VKYSHVFTPINEATFYFLQSIRTPTLDIFMLGLTFLASSTVIFFIFTAITLWFMRLKQWRMTLAWVINALLGGAALALAKYAFYSPRPGGFSIVRESSSFPSGHVMRATIIFGLFAFLISLHQCNKLTRQILFIALATVISLIGLSRLYLGAHWLTDIIGSLLLGASFLILSAIILHHQPARVQTSKLLIIAFSSLLLGFSFQIWRQGTKQLAAYQPLEKTLSTKANTGNSETMRQ